jgi:5'-AMP-activated protein kinase catalytic alpha subunit
MKQLLLEHRAALRGKYELVSFRGGGNFSEVWEARHVRTGLRVAIKILNHAKMKDAKLKPERESLVMRLLSLGRHPHIAHFYEAIRPAATADQYTYIVMELAESGELHDDVTVT